MAPQGSDVAQRGYGYEDHDLVVALPHLGLVTRKLEDSGVPIPLVETSYPLGLALLSLPPAADAAALITRQIDETLESRATAAGHSKPQDPLDQVLWGLRVLFAEEYAGWTPTLGKNRTLEKVLGGGEVSHGGGGGPDETAERLKPRGPGGGAGVHVGVLDTALFPHPWLDGAYIARTSDLIKDLTEQGTAPPAADGHSTFIAGLVLTQAESATVDARKVLNENGSADSWAVAKQIVDFGRSGLDVLNLSFYYFANPVTGERHKAHIVLPDGFIWTKGECGVGSFTAAAEGLSLNFDKTNWILYDFDWSN